MAIGVAAASSVFLCVITVFDALISRKEARDTEDQIDEVSDLIESNFLDLEEDLDTLLNNDVTEGLALLTSAFDDIQAYRFDPETDLQEREDERDAIISQANTGLDQVKLQATNIISASGSSLNAIQNALAVAQKALLLRMQISLEIEFGLTGSFGLRADAN